MGEKSTLLWFSLRRIDGAWRCQVWNGKRAVFTCYESCRDDAWNLAWRHLLAVAEVTA